MLLDGEPWKFMTIRAPNGRVIMDTQNHGRLRSWGLTSLFFESAEPGFEEVPFAEFKQRFPQGRYRFRGETVDGKRLAGADRLSHRIPAKPDVTFPTEGALVDPNALVVTWPPVTSPAGIQIDRYQVIVTNETRDGDIEMDLPPTATGASIPPEFLNTTDEFKVEVIARAQNGNQTISEISFRTS